MPLQREKRQLLRQRRIKEAGKQGWADQSQLPLLRHPQEKPAMLIC